MKQVAAVFQVGSSAGLTDGSLLERFLGGPPDQAEAAFEALVERHGPMVLRVCRRVLGDRHDAEDAAQATFLVLARQARSIRRMDSVASWLYGVAGRVATRARRGADRRRLRERRSVEAATAIRRAGDDDRETSDTSSEIRGELDRLPDRFRLPVLLCDLEGLTYEQASLRLGCPVRTVQSRLARARRRLRDRLTRRGLDPTSPLPVAVLSPKIASELVSEGWKHATVRAAVRFAAGRVPSSVTTATVAALAEGASRAMILHRSMKWAALLTLIGFAGGGAGMAMLAPAGPSRAEPPGRDENRYRVTLGGSATIEVVAVSTVPTGPDTWWKPDGTRLDQPPVDRIEPQAEAREGKADRVILVRASGSKPDDLFRWNPTLSESYWGGRPTKDGREVPGLEYYEATYSQDRADCGIKARVAAGPWKTEVSNDGGGGTGLFVNGHKFSFGKARPLTARGRSMTVFSVAHNFFGQDRRLVAVDRDGKPHPAVSYSVGSDGDKKWVIDLIDGEFALPPEQVREFQVQFRPIEEAEILGISLRPNPANR